MVKTPEQESFEYRYWQDKRRLSLAPRLGRAAVDSLELNRRAESEIRDVLAEGLTGVVSSHYEYQIQDGLVIGADGEPLIDMLRRWQAQVDEMVAANDYYADFLPQRAAAEIAEIEAQQCLPGSAANLLVTFSASDDQRAANSNDHRLLKAAGLKPQWRRNMFRLSYWDGQKLHLFTRSFDNMPLVHDAEAADSITLIKMIAEQQLGARLQSDSAESLLAERLAFKIESVDDAELLADRLVATGDYILRQLYGGEWRAGRSPQDGRDTYALLDANQHIINAALQEFRQIADQSSSFQTFLAARNRRLYDYLALLDAADKSGPISVSNIHQSASHAGLWARAAGRDFDACGLLLTADQKPNSLNGIDSIFGLLNYVNRPVRCPDLTCQKDVVVPIEALLRGVLYCRCCGLCVDPCGGDTSIIKLELDQKYRPQTITKVRRSFLRQRVG